MERKTEARPGTHPWPAARFWIAPALLVAAALLAVLAAQTGARKAPDRLLTPAPTRAAAAAAPGLGSVEDVQRIDPAEAKALADQGQAVIYDVRSQESFAAGHAAGAVSLPYDQVQAQASTLPRDKMIILYCT